jgi:hypothetical protein
VGTRAYALAYRNHPIDPIEAFDNHSHPPGGFPAWRHLLLEYSRPSLSGPLPPSVMSSMSTIAVERPASAGLLPYAIRRLRSGNRSHKRCTRTASLRRRRTHSAETSHSYGRNGRAVLTSKARLRFRCGVGTVAYIPSGCSPACWLSPYGSVTDVSRTHR